MRPRRRDAVSGLLLQIGVVLVNSTQDIDMTCYCFQMQVYAYNATYKGKMKTAAAASPMTVVGQLEMGRNTHADDKP
jgi:hypothetical protein